MPLFAVHAPNLSYYSFHTSDARPLDDCGVFGYAVIAGVYLMAGATIGALFVIRMIIRALRLLVGRISPVRETDRVSQIYFKLQCVSNLLWNPRLSK